MKGSVGIVAALSDADIRDRLGAWLAKEFAHDSTTVVHHEFAVPRPSARADVAVINGRLSGFEIKSDVDSLSRLPQQIRSYNAVFERITLVTTKTHLTNALTYIPEWWGVLVAYPMMPLKPLRVARLNKSLDIERALYLLSCNELREISIKQNSAYSSKSRKSDLIAALCRSTSKTKLIDDIRTSLKMRLNQANRLCRHSQADI